MYSDHGSEWTFPGITVDELEEIGSAKAMTSGGEWRHEVTPGGELRHKLTHDGEWRSHASDRDVHWYEAKYRRGCRPHTSYPGARAHPNTPTTGKYIYSVWTMRSVTASYSEYFFF